jgi:beta-lactamase regulating signal transducer with metallopeptidase domain
MESGAIQRGREAAKARLMAIRRRPPHPARGLIIWLIILALAIAGAVWLAGSAEEVPLRTIEVDVARPS